MLIQKHNSQFLVVLEKDQKIMSTLTEIASGQKILGGHITGIGAVKDLELGYYDLHKKEYIRKFFNDDDYELLSLNGNITLKDGQPYVHIHTAIGDRNFQVFGGHLFEAKVAVTAEIYITPFGLMPERELNQELGLATICRCPAV